VHCSCAALRESIIAFQQDGFQQADGLVGPLLG
jgi:hypothetical protein